MTEELEDDSLAAQALAAQHRAGRQPLYGVRHPKVGRSEVLQAHAMEEEQAPFASEARRMVVRRAPRNQLP